MTQAVKNERLAVRQKLIDVYREKTDPLIEHLQQKQLKFEQDIQQLEQVAPFSFFVEFCYDKEYADGLLIYDNNGQIIFPVPPENSYFIDTAKFEKAWKSEFVDSNYINAAREYEKAIMPSSIPYEVFYGKLAMTRCYEKASNIERAIGLCRELAYPGKHIVKEYASSDIIQARLKLVQLYQKQNTSIFEKEAAQLLSDMIVNTHNKPLPSEMRIFILNELLELIDNSQLLKQSQKILQAERLSLDVSEEISEQAPWDNWQEKTLKPIHLDEKIYGTLFKTENRKVILVSRRKSITDVMKYIAEKLSDSTVTVSVFDEQNILTFGENKNPNQAFLTIRPNDYLGEWKLCFFFRNSEVFDQAASKQAAIYTWTSILVIGLMAVCTCFAGSAVGRQIKLNRLKNDFVATVTHELKTPLASMRVLVDTLLDGSYNDQQQATEYLQLISKENRRLTGLIDNFLTFSRMERNKQAFDLDPADPADIANSAADAVRTKFNGGKCEFTVSIDDDLPLVSADKDAMITVLVNLLDNAYKYSYDDKHIELKVFAAETGVCFSVKDSGIGMTPRQTKKIFNRFYQADSSLARKTEGTGLGLSIVKFILDAHNATITVDSQPEKGSEFKVKLPIV